MNSRQHRKRLIRPTIAANCLLILLSAAQSTVAAEPPWRLSDALNLSDGFSLSGSHRSRLETLSNNLRIGRSENDEIFTFRTILNAQYQNNGLSTQLELMDSRQQLADPDSIISTGNVNSLDILQANVAYRFGKNANSRIKLGRFTADGGSRRLLARNRYRNTLNAFEGIELNHQAQNGNSVRVLATRVVKRLPSDLASLLENERENDESSDAQKFYGIETSFPNLFRQTSSEFYLYSIREKDRPGIKTRNREIDSAGARFRRAPAAGEVDFEIESVYQFGEQHASSSSTDLSKLDHQAYFQFFMLGYSFDVPSRLRVLFEVDYASGDSDPLDQDSGRFDSLHGVTTFSFGPTGIYGVFSRSNLISPGLRASFNPKQNLNIMASYRHFWLAEKKDSLGRTGLRDTSGDSGRYLGQHLELRARWDLAPGNVRIETGLVFLQNKNLSNKNTSFFYGGVNLSF